jgi:hypothetical protein
VSINQIIKFVAWFWAGAGKIVILAGGEVPFPEFYKENYP